MAGAERVQRFREISRFVHGARLAGDQEETIDEGVESVLDRHTWDGGYWNRLDVGLLGHAGVHELIPVTRYGSDELRLARVVAQRAPERAHRLRERAVGDDDVAPDGGEDRVFRHRVVPPLHEHDEQVEILRNEGDGRAVPQQHALPRCEHEVVEPEAHRTDYGGPPMLSADLLEESLFGYPDGVMATLDSERWEARK